MKVLWYFILGQKTETQKETDPVAEVVESFATNRSGKDSQLLMKVKKLIIERKLAHFSSSYGIVIILVPASPMLPLLDLP